MRTIPLFGTGIRSISDIVTRQRRVNCIYEIRKDQDRSAVVLLGTPGSAPWLTLPTGPVRGWHVISNTLYVCSGNVLYSVTPAGTYTVVATGIGGMGNVSFADNSLQLLIVTGTAGYIYTVATSTLAPITDVFFPQNATSVVFLNGRFVVNKGGTREFYVSALLDGFTWTYLDSTPIYGTKENSSDLLLRVGNLNGTLVLWGEQSIEFWQDVGLVPLPYQRINGATQSWGLAAVLSNVEIGNTQMFLGSTPDGGYAIIRLNGYVPEPVSDSDLDTLFASFTTVSDAVAYTYTVYGHPIYQITFPSENRSFAYDSRTGVWHEAQTGPGDVARHFSNYGVTFSGKNYVSDAVTGSGTIYLLDKDSYTDNGAVIKRQVVTRHLRNAGNELSIAELFLDFETGVGNGVVDPQVAIRISRDGGHVFGNERWVPLGKIGEFYQRVLLRRLGSARDFVVQITVTDPVKFVLASGSAVLESADE
jgi:hypothetical protein